MNETIAVRTDFRLVDESPDWLIVDKPAPLIVHPTSEKKEPTLLLAFAHALTAPFCAIPCPPILVCLTL